MGDECDGHKQEIVSGLNPARRRSPLDEDRLGNALERDCRDLAAAATVLSATKGVFDFKGVSSTNKPFAKTLDMVDRNMTRENQLVGSRGTLV